MAYDLTSEAFFAEPGPTLERLRREAPVHFHEPLGSWVLTRHDDVLLALRDPRFSVDRNGAVGRSTDPAVQQALADCNRLLLRWMVFADPPLHTRLREAVSKPFARASIDAMREPVDRAARAMAAALPRGEPFDLVERFCVELPERITAAMLGLPADALASLQRHTDAVFALLGAPDASADVVLAAHRALGSLRAFFGAVLDERRGRPGDDLLSQLVRSEASAPTLSEDDLVGVCITLVVGAFGTTALLIANAALALLQRPGLWRALAHDDELASGAVEETLRTDGPALAVVRRLRCGVEVGGAPMREGDRIYLMLHAANHDPEAFERPEVFDPRRRPNRHVGLGAGPHVCLGAPLTRLEASRALAALASALPDLALSPGGAVRTGNLSMRGLASLRVQAGQG